jgi:choline dehydrogenase-like flavoprotein
MSKAELAFRVLRRNILQGQFSRDLGENILQMSENLSAVAHAATCNIQGKRKRANKWGLHVQVEEPPNRENRVTLGHKKDALGMNMLKARRPQSVQSRRTVLRTVEIFAAELMRFELGRTRLDGGHLKSRLFTDDGSQGLHFGHDMGTTRMSNDPSKGVVDKHCRIHSAKNLYIAGSSVFSTSGFANPTYTIMALALRIAEHIKVDLSHETLLSD